MRTLMFCDESVIKITCLYSFSNLRKCKVDTYIQWTYKCEMEIVLQLKEWFGRIIILIYKFSMKGSWFLDFGTLSHTKSILWRKRCYKHGTRKFKRVIKRLVVKWLDELIEFIVFSDAPKRISIFSYVLVV